MWKTTSLNEGNEQEFLFSLKKNKLLHIFTFYDLTSTVSALVKELFRLRVEPGLWVAEDNAPAVRVYEKIGFKPSKNTLLGFTAKKK
jgi:hypothetical protein